ncbi:MAG: hypothetical protein GQ532_08265 [Methylomarinum sp.]|nr:hypothetical protein [Methylomarinum sp.]
MNKILFILLFVFNSAYAEFNSKHIIELDEYSDGTHVQGKSRVRIRFLMDDVNGFDDTLIQSVDICNLKKRCERINKFVDDVFYDDNQVVFGHSLTTSGDKGVFIHLQVRNGVKGRKNLSHRLIKLKNHLVFEENIGYEVFIRLNEIGNGHYKPEFAGYAPMSPSEDKVVLYEPSEELNVDAGGGFNVQLDIGSTPRPVIVGLEYSRNDLREGTLQISPDISFTIPMIVIIEFNDYDLTQGTGLNDYMVKLNQETLATEYIGVNDIGNSLYKVRLDHSGLLTITEKGPFQNVSQLSQNNFEQAQRTFATAQITDTCVSNINSIGDGYYTYVDQNAAASFTSCLDVDPKVHMVISKINDSRNTIKFSAEKQSSSPINYKLKTITSHASNIGAWAMINGFVWDGDSGSSAGQLGNFLGTHYLNGVNVNNRSTAEAIIGFTQKTSSNSNNAMFYDKNSTSNFGNFSPYNYNLVSSTTSIVKNGNCTASSASPGETNAWSALGLKTLSGNKYLVMLSSVTGSETNAYDLCQMLKALSVNNAIRLDGASAASLYVNGVHKNPLSGLRKLYYGSARHVLYGIGVQ